MYPEKIKTGEMGRVFKFYSNKDSQIVLGLASLKKKSFKYLIAGLSMWRGLEPRDCLGMTSDVAHSFEEDSNRESWNRGTERGPFQKIYMHIKLLHGQSFWFPWRFLGLLFLFRSHISPEPTRCQQQILYFKSLPSGMMKHEISGKLEKHKSATGLTGSAARSIDNNWGLASCTIYFLLASTHCSSFRAMQFAVEFYLLFLPQCGGLAPSFNRYAI